MGVGSKGGVLPLDLHDTDKVEGGLMVLFFGLVFSIGLLWKIFCQRFCLFPPDCEGLLWKLLMIIDYVV